MDFAPAISKSVDRLRTQMQPPLLFTRQLTERGKTRIVGPQREQEKRRDARAKQQGRTSVPHLEVGASAACLAVAALLALSACASLKVKLGTRVNLEKTPLASMKASLHKVRESRRDRKCRWW